MPTSEKFCLKWNDFQQNINTAFEALRKDVEFTDVTLACEDGNQVEAHRVVLAASSPFFHNLMKGNKHAHPLIYMRGMKFEDLLAIVDFLYYGEAKIYQDNLDTFLNIAGELDLKGLNGGEGSREEGRGEQEYPSKHTDKPTDTNASPRKNELHPQPQNHPIPHESYAKDQDSFKVAIALPKQEFSGDLKDLNVKVNSMIGRNENMVKVSEGIMIKAYVCQVCGREGQGHVIRDHIEAIHLEGISVPCNSCNQTFRTRQALRKHNSKLHTSSI